MLKIRVVMENKTYRDGMAAEHGLSLLIDAKDRRILFDAGASSLLLSNMKHLAVEPKTINTVIISHGHFDHTGGLPAFIEHNAKAEIMIHREAFYPFYGMEDGKLDETTCGIRWNDIEKAAILKRTKLIDGPFWIDEDTVVSGTIPVEKGFVPTEEFYIKHEDETLTTDPMGHEQFLAIRDHDAKGIHVISGCSHTGTISALRYTETLFPGEKILSLVGGFHMYSTTEAARKRAIKELLAEGPEILVPLHCTGILALCEIKRRIGPRCVIAGAGDKLELR